MENYDKLLQLGLLYMVNEIKDPLTSIVLSVELLEKESGESDPEKFIEILKRNSKMMIDKIATISTFLSAEKISLTALCANEGRHDGGNYNSSVYSVSNHTSTSE